MIQVHSCNLVYSSIVMTDGVFERVSEFVMIPCFLKNGVCLQHHLSSYLLAKMIQVFLHS